MKQGFKTGLAVFFLITTLLTSAQGATLTGSSTTMPMFFQETGGGENVDFAPVYEYLRLSLSDLGVQGVSLHLSGWAKAELYDYLPGDAKNGDLNYGYLDWQLGNRVLQVRAGRQFVFMGVASRQTDGVMVRFEKYNLGVGLIGGSPVTGPEESSAGDFLTGGQIYYTLRLRQDLGGELALSYLSLQNGEQPDQSLAGLNLGLRPMSNLDISGHVYYDFLQKEIYDAAVIPTYQPWRTLKVSLRYYHTIPSALISKNSIFSVFSNAEVQKLGGGVDYDILRNLTVQADYLYLFYNDYFGREYGGSLSYRYGKKSRNEVFLGIRRGDEDENGYIEPRVYLRQELGKNLHLGLNLICAFYDESIKDQDYSLSLGPDLSYILNKNIKLVGAFDFTESPIIQEEYRGTLKLVYDFAGFVSE